MCAYHTTVYFSVIHKLSNFGVTVDYHSTTLFLKNKETRFLTILFLGQLATQLY
nr:MAG TPA: hypothetical protein [Caudoviricetes sp.]